jgi:hypothetical protein
VFTLTISTSELTSWNLRRRKFASGWKGLIERHLENGVLETLTTDYARFDRGIYAILTARGRGHPLARQFMDCLNGQ